LPSRVCLDTNGYPVGAADENSPEGRILRWLGFEGEAPMAEAVWLNPRLPEEKAKSDTGQPH
jgi:hypothetical protein